MIANYTNNQNSWQERSEKMGTSLNGVLFKNLPEVVNLHIHNWHWRIICSFIKMLKPKTAIDIGCGYGRLSSLIIKEFPSIEIMGLDVSSHYAKLYYENLKRPVLNTSVTNIPSNLGKFDCILVITTLMYVPKDELPSVFSSLLSHMTENGGLILIEKNCSGNFFQNPFNIKRFFIKKTNPNETENVEHCFSDKEINSLCAANGVVVNRKSRMPFTTFFIVPIYLISKVLPQSFSKNILKIFAWFDKILETFPLPSIHSAYLIKKVK